MNSHNSVSVDSSVIRGFFRIFVESWESVRVMWDMESSINSSFQGSENSVTGGGVGKSNIKNSFEWFSFFVGFIFNIVSFSSRGGNSSIERI